MSPIGPPSELSGLLTTAHRTWVRSLCRLQAQYKNLVLVHLPVHGSWLGQVAIYLSIVEREGLSSGDFSFLTAVTQRLFEFEEYYEQIARQFQWKFTRKDLHDLLTELDTATKVLQETVK